MEDVVLCSYPVVMSRLSGVDLFFTCKRIRASLRFHFSHTLLYFLTRVMDAASCREMCYSFTLQTNEVNQGDALEHDFSCMYVLLQLPVDHLMDAHLSNVSNIEIV